MSDQRNEFLKGLRSSANEFNYYGMKFEDAIVKILEEEGMKKEIAQNADAKKAIINLLKQDKRIPGDEKLNSDNISFTRYVLKQFINTDGTIKGKSDEMILYNEQSENIQTTTIDVKDGKLVTTEIVNMPKLEYSTTVTKTIEHGVEMEVVESNNKGRKDTYTRKSDLVTTEVHYEDTFRNVGRGGFIQAGAEKIGSASRSIYFDIQKRIQDIDEARANGKTPEGFLYEGKDQEKIKELNEEKRSIFEKYYNSSENFRKLAETKGLVQATGIDK